MSTITPSTADEIAELFRGAIRSGQLGDGERLPTVRQTARDFDVAQATAAKAYKALEHDGLVTTRTAAGTRVAAGASRAPQAVIENIRALIDASESASLTADDVIAIMRLIWPTQKHSHESTDHHQATGPDSRVQDHEPKPATTR